MSKFAARYYKFVNVRRCPDNSYLFTALSLRRIQKKSRPEVFCKKGVLENFARFTGKYLCRSICFNNVAGLRPAALLKRRSWHRCVPVNFATFSRTSFLYNTYGGCFCIQKPVKYLRWSFYQKYLNVKSFIFDI